MPIEGPLAFRANSWEGGKEVSSPLWPFKWESPVVWAKCKNAQDYLPVSLDPLLEAIPVDQIPDDLCCLDEDDHLIPGFAHTCGIWATLDDKVVKTYVKDAGGVMYLVEAIGHYVLHDSGWRAGGAQIVGIVNTSFLADAPKLRTPTEDERSLNIKISAVGLSIMAAADKYRVPVIESDVALEMALITWLREGMPWPL